MHLSDNCLFCQKNDFVEVFPVANYKIVRCINCGLVSTRSINFQRIVSVNTQSYTKEDYLKWYFSVQNISSLKKRAIKRLREIKKHALGNNLLDVGCSYGFFLEEALNDKWEAEGIDLYKESIEFCKKKKIPVRLGELSKLTFNKRYDVLTYWDVLEHVVDPFRELKQARKILKVGGVLAIQVPNFASLISKISKTNFGWLCPDEHLTHFDPKTLVKLLEATGFSILKVKTWVGTDSYLYDFLKSVLAQSEDKLCPRLILKTAYGFDKFFPFFTNGISLVESIFRLNGLIIVYARKKK